MDGGEMGASVGGASPSAGTAPSNGAWSRSNNSLPDRLCNRPGCYEPDTPLSNLRGPHQPTPGPYADR